MQARTRHSLMRALISLLVGAAEASAQRKADLTRLVVLGDSMSAGYQNGSLFWTQQLNGYASRIAEQSQTTLVLPLIGSPGIPNAMLLLNPGPPPQTARLPGLSNGRMNPTDQPANLAVPGAYISDLLTARPNFDSPDLTYLVLGLPGKYTGRSRTQVEAAEALAPTTVILWAGNMDVLCAASAGNPRLITPSARFEAAYRAVADRLAQTGATLVFANIPDVTTMPYFTSAEQAASVGGAPLSSIGPVLGIGAGDYVTPEAFGAIPSILSGSQPAPLPSRYVLTRQEIATFRAAVRSFNNVIAATAREKDAVLVDLNGLAAQMHARGHVVGGRRLTTAFLGGIFSLDGVHPTNTGHAIIANEFIAALDSRAAAGIAPVSIERLKDQDPLVLPSDDPARTIGHVRSDAARSMRSVCRAR